MSDERIRVAFVHLGCAKNLIDAEKMGGLLEEAGYVVDEDLEAADVIIVNTCGFISDAKEESIEEILSLLRGAVDDSPAVIAAGCLAQRYPSELAEGIPELSGILGVNDLEEVTSVVESAARGERLIRVSSSSHGWPDPKLRHRWTPSHIAYLKIAEGCDRRCSYCAIPLIRGPYRSKPAEDILREAHSLVEEGAREINLVAQDVTLYRSPGGDVGLNGLLKRLARELPDVWVRILYAHPAGLDEELVETLSGHANLCSYLDVPLQHASPRILRAMGRPEDPDHVRDFLSDLRRNHPEFSVRSTFMVGFPTETEADFEYLTELVRDLELDDVAIFPFSPEDGTPAEGLPEPVPTRVARERANALRRIAEESSFSAKQRFVGRELEAVLDQRGANGWLARHRGQAPEVDGAIVVDGLSDTSLAVGDRLRVRIEGADAVDLWGTACRA
ncbi:MAG: 30S ribosomal protein S12 methylthiotransferase RimO [Bacillota bacterium]